MHPRYEWKTISELEAIKIDRRQCRFETQAQAIR